MSAKRSRFDTRTILIVVLVLIIIAAAYILFTSLPPAEEDKTPEEVLRNKDKYLNGGSIVVKGYFIYDAGHPSVVSTLSNTEGRSVLWLDFEGLDENETDKLKTDTMFRFTGVLIKEDPDNPLNTKLLFDVTKIDEV